jgi:predicted dehydrogenase
MSRRTNRRQFLRDSALAGVGFWAAGGVSLAGTSRSVLEKLNIACIGVGGKGSSDTDHAGNHGNVVALCDIDGKTLDKKAAKFDQAKKFFDYREMLTTMGKDIDAVTVSGPDHVHAPASVMAMKLKKHVYCQKPLTHDVFEARTMREVAKKMGVSTQMGNQGTAADGLRRAVEFIQAGGIGKVTQAHVWTNRPIWPQAPKVTARPKETPPIPEHVKWDLFLGVAPERPYNPCYHPFAWRGWWDFGTGALGDMACHTANMAFMALKLGYPTTIAAENGEINPETYPGWARINFQFPARGDMPAVKFVWYEGHKDGATVLPAAELVKGQGEKDKDNCIFFKDKKWYFRSAAGRTKDVSSGSFLIGEKAILFSPDDYGADAYVITEDRVERLTGKPEKLPSNNRGDNGMKAEWVKAIAEGKPSVALSNFDYAAMLTETILLGNVAMRVGKKLEWDGPNLKVTNCPEAEKYIKREYRKGWTL